MYELNYNIFFQVHYQLKYIENYKIKNESHYIKNGMIKFIFLINFNH